MQATKAVRAVMRKFGRDSDSIFTNRYEKCQTVKCYAGTDPEQLVAAISAEMIRLGHDLVTVTMRHNGVRDRAWGTCSSIIVRIPL
jgi:hypothetical protein